MNRNYKLETNLNYIHKQAVIREDENYRFRRYLKSQSADKIDKIVHRLHHEITRRIDCTTCGNCCEKLAPNFSEEEVDYLAKIEKISSKDYIKKYCVVEDGDIYLKTEPCRYLKDKNCTIFENMPIKCSTFPYTKKPNFTGRLYSMIEFYAICPIVYNIMEILKDELRFRR